MQKSAKKQKLLGKLRLIHYTVSTCSLKEGDVKSSNGTVEVKGKVLGNVEAASVSLHQNGDIEGAITAKSVSLQGDYQGTLKCEDLHVAATSNVKGDVSANTMTTERGAILVGKVNITG